jgi:hypothetical protein
MAYGTSADLFGDLFAALFSALVPAYLDVTGSALLISTLCTARPGAPIVHLAIRTKLSITRLFVAALRLTQIGGAWRAPMHCRLLDVSDPMLLAFSAISGACTPFGPFGQ